MIELGGQDFLAQRKRKATPIGKEESEMSDNKDDKPQQVTIPGQRTGFGNS